MFLSYYFLPEGFLKGKAVSDRIVGTEASHPLLTEWGKIAGYNLGAVCLLVLHLQKSLTVLLQFRDYRWNNGLG